MTKRVHRAILLSALVLEVLGAPGCLPREASEGEARESSEAADVQVPIPRVVLLLSLDTLRADHLGFYGYEEFTSPVLDMMAAEGVVFEDASAPSPWTLPSHASMLTGLYPKQHGVQTMATALPKDIPTLVIARNLFHGSVGIIFSMILLAGIYSTAVPMLWITCNSLIPDETSRRFKMLAATLTVLAFFGSQASFAELVNIIYPLSGYLGLLLIVCMLIKQITSISRRT